MTSDALIRALTGSAKPDDIFKQTLIRNALDYSPVQHWTQGASRLAQALLGGLEMRNDDRSAEEALRVRMNAPGLQDGPPVVPNAMPSVAPQVMPQQRPPAGPAPRAPIFADDATANTPQDRINLAFGATPQDREIATRTVLGEAANQGQPGMNAVADVIRNRAAAGGYGGNTMGAVSTARNQFEPWNTPQGRARMAAYSPDSAIYGQAQAAVDSAGVGARPDASGGAHYFYAPQAQAALAPVDGRPVVPPFAAGRDPTAVVGGHAFFAPQTRLAQAGGVPPVGGGAAPEPSAAPPVGSQPRSVVEIPPEIRSHINRLYATRNAANIAQADALYQQYAKPREQFQQLVTPQERAAAGIDPSDTTRYQRDAQGKISPINPQPFQVNVNQQQESEFRKNAGKLTAERYNKIVEDGHGAQGMVADINALRELGSRIEPGKTTELKAALGPWAEAAGIKIDKLDDMQAFKAIVARMAPRLRVPGSGAQSDFELRQFLESLPSLGNTPGGNEMIANTLQALQEHKIKAAEIASQAMNGEISQSEADKRIRALEDPMTLWRRSRGSSAVAPQRSPQDIADELRRRGLIR